MKKITIKSIIKLYWGVYCLELRKTAQTYKLYDRERNILSVDLHCHTKLSDGSLGIDDLIILAKKRGVNTISITDKNCQAGNVRAKLIGERHSVDVINGVEISSFDEKANKEVDIICYLADSPDRLEGLCRKNSLACRKASQYMIINVAKKYPITPDLVSKCASGSTNIFTHHIMKALMETGYSTCIYSELYDELFTPGGKNSVFVQPKYENTKTVIEAIHEAGGVAILAHSGKYTFDEIESYISMGIDGLEAWTPHNDEETTENIIKFAKKNKILVTGGSDFHGFYSKKTISVGQYTTPEKNLEELLAYKARRKRMQKKAALAASK